MDMNAQVLVNDVWKSFDGGRIEVLKGVTLEVAQGEVVLVNDRYGIRLTRVVSAAQRIKNL